MVIFIYRCSLTFTFLCLTNGNPKSQSCSHKTTRGGSTDSRSPVNQLRDPLENTAQSSHVVNAPEAAASKRNVPLVHPVQQHLLRWYPPFFLFESHCSEFSRCSRIVLLCWMNFHVLSSLYSQRSTGRSWRGYCTTYEAQASHENNTVVSSFRLLLNSLNVINSISAYRHHISQNQ